MALTYQSITSSLEIVGTDTLSFSFSRTGTGLVVIQTWGRQLYASGQAEVLTCNVGGTPANFRGFGLDSDGIGISSWDRYNLGPGTYTVDIKYAGALTYGGYAAAICYDGNATFESFASLGDGSYTSTPQLTVTPETNSSHIIGIVGHGNSGALAPMGSFTERLDVDAFLANGEDMRLGISTLDTTSMSPITVGFTAAGVDNWLVGGLVYATGSGGGGGGGTSRRGPQMLLVGV